jgi:N-methylhydantoinase A/oxoprolinase/acetone carboxylase beta subunit
MTMPPAATAPPMLRVGIDVGGTFTDVVAVDAVTRAVVARIKVPTTHRASEGVAAGIVAGVQALLATPGIVPEQIAFIAHSTTQATNALLEGDVARVGILGLAGSRSWLARSQLRLPPIALGPNAELRAEIAYSSGEAASVEAALAILRAAGSEAVAVSEAFGVDRPERERDAVALARASGFYATSGHDVSAMYGLRARTRTAVLNAAILPTMVRTARMTASAVERAGIGTALMIMRSDGGVMDVREVAERPILTMLSGPAAGIAGALLHENVTDGIFIEVGGTSADCSVIRRGLPQMRPARVGGHRTMLRNLDVRTLGIAGGSLARFDPRGRGAGALRDVGPRSAHIAGLQYASFREPGDFRDARIAFVRAQAGDPDDYLVLELRGGERCALTPTCAANLLGYVPESAFARGNRAAVEAAFALAGTHFGCSGEELARAILTRAAEKLSAAIGELIDDYELDRRTIELVGGGGGAAALVPFAAERLGFAHRLARDAEVISPIGVALALVRDVVERTIVNPSPDDVIRLRREAFERVVAAGASPDLVEVSVEIDARRNLVRATASGATAAVANAVAAGEASPDARKAAALRALRAPEEELEAPHTAGAFELFTVRRAPRSDEADIAVVDDRAVVRSLVRRGAVHVTTAGALEATLRRVLEAMTSFGDVGRALPETTLVYGRRVADLGTLAEPAQVLALASEEVRGLDPATLVAILSARRPA